MGFTAPNCTFCSIIFLNEYFAISIELAGKYSFFETYLDYDYCHNNLHTRVGLN